MDKEPSCVLNHDMLRKNLRDSGQDSLECPVCHWILHPSKDTYYTAVEPKFGTGIIFTQQQVDLIRELVVDVLVANDLIKKDDDD